MKRKNKIKKITQKFNKRKFLTVIIFVFVFCLFGAYTQTVFAQESLITKDAPAVEKNTEIKINSDNLDYNPAKNEIIATGNAEVIIDEGGSRLLADKITYNQDTQIVTAEKNVRLIKNGQIIKGDFTRINLQEESAIIEKPNTKIAVVRINAEKANIYTDKIDALKGRAEIEEKLNLFLSSDSFGDYQRIDELRNEYLDAGANTTLSKKLGSGYRIEAKEIIIESGEAKNVITLKKADVFIGKHKIVTMPSLVIKTDKAYSQAETQLPEIGTVRQIGFYAGPSKLINLPKDASLKLTPIISFYDDIGVGGLARFRTEKNRTEIGYATSKEKFVTKGIQQLPNDFQFVYGSNSYIRDGFMGDRLPKYFAEIAQDKTFDVKDINATYRNRFAAGYVSDFTSGWGTTRFTWMGDLNKPILSYDNKVVLSINPQFSARVYGNGDTSAVIRIGPTLETRFWNWYNRFGYYLAGVEGDSPLIFDKYYYGKNSFVWMTEKKINRNLNLGFNTVLNLNKDNYDKKLVSENQLFMRVGPDDMKFRLGYDIIRQRTMFGMDLLVGSDSTSVGFDKLKVVDPSNLKKKKTSKTPKNDKL